MAKAGKKARSTKHERLERHERRFFPSSTTPTAVVGALGGLGALAMGGGFWAQWGRVLFAANEESLPFGWWMLAGGAVLLGIAIWVGTSGEALLRVGDGGVGVERGGFFGTLPLRRIPWHAVESVAYDGASATIVMRGRDESGSELVISARLKSQPQAAAWIVREARERVPAVLDVGEVALGEARTDAGESLTLDPVQVVGKRCAASGTIIAFEPDARVCPKCERIYHKDHVPAACACGAPLSARADAGEGVEIESAHADTQTAAP
jgi:hypothetical protein